MSTVDHAPAAPRSELPIARLRLLSLLHLHGHPSLRDQLQDTVGAIDGCLPMKRAFRFCPSGLLVCPAVPMLGDAVPLMGPSTNESSCSCEASPERVFNLPDYALDEGWVPRTPLS